MGTDISSILGGISASSNSSFSLSDYAAIKNGSYKKLMKAYYTQEDEEAAAAKSESRSGLLSVRSGADSLKGAADALQSDKLWQKKEVTKTDEKSGEETVGYEYDWDSITDAVKSFANAYNSMVESTGRSDTKDVLRNAAWMTQMTMKNSRALASIGIEIGKDNKMTVNEEKLKASGDRVKSLFKGYNSYGDKISYKASQISNSAERAAIKQATAYNKNGQYTNSITSSIKDKVDEATSKKTSTSSKSDNSFLSGMTTANTDKADQEIKELKSKRDSLKQKINSEYSTERRREYEKELKQVEKELAIKDTEQYRKQNTIFS